MYVCTELDAFKPFDFSKAEEGYICRRVGREMMIGAEDLVPLNEKKVGM